MIIFGTRGRVILGPGIEQVSCPSCGKSTHTSFGILRYFHIFWVPVFPTSKKAGTECVHCKHTLIGKDLPREMHHDIKSQVFTKRAVLPMFTGLVIIALLFLFGIYSAEEMDKKEAQYLVNPKINDYYVVDYRKIFDEIDTKHPYGILRIIQIQGDEVEMKIGLYGYSRSTRALKAIREGETRNSKYYSDETITFHRDELTGMRENGVIRAIKRI